VNEDNKNNKKRELNNNIKREDGRSSRPLGGELFTRDGKEGQLAQKGQRLYSAQGGGNQESN